MTFAVFDCVVYVQAALNADGPAASCLTLVEDGQVKLFAAPAILAEIRDTLSKTKLRNKFPHLTDERVEEFLQHIGQLAELIHDVPSIFPLPRDPDDAVYVDLALASNAAYLVSRDKDLLDLMNDSTFRNQFPHLTVLDPVQFLVAVQQKS